MIARIAFLVIVYCCVRGCSCPAWCGPCCCCCKREDDRDLVYKVTGAQVNQSFQSDVSRFLVINHNDTFKEGEKKYPLPDAYSNHGSTVRNPAVWYDMPTNDFGLVKSGQPQGTILTTGKATSTFIFSRNQDHFKSL